MMAEPRTTDKPQPPTLHCCQGEPAPDGVVYGWRQMLAMQTSTQQAFVELLTRSVVDPDDAALGGMLAGFCDAHALDREAALVSLKACQFLLQRAAALDLDAQRFMEDLQKLSADDSSGLRLVASRYLPLKQRIREHLLDQTLADHGKVLVDLDWRVDTVTSSDRAIGLNAPVVLLTLRLRDGEQSERVSVQLTARSIQLLRQFCQRFSESGGSGSV